MKLYISTFWDLNYSKALGPPQDKLKLGYFSR